MERSRRRATQTYGSPSAASPVRGSPRASRQASTAAPTMDNTPSFTPSGRPLRQKSAANLRNVTPPAVAPPPSRPVRSSSSRAIKKNSSPVDDYEEEEDDYMEEDVEEEVAAAVSLRSKRSTRGLKQQQQSPAPVKADPEPAVSSREKQQRQASTSSPLKVTLGRRDRASTRKSNKRARLAEEEDAGWMPEVDEEDEAQLVFTAIVAKIEQWLSERGSAKLQSFFKKVPAKAEVSDTISTRFANIKVLIHLSIG